MRKKKKSTLLLAQQNITMFNNQELQIIQQVLFKVQITGQDALPLAQLQLKVAELLKPNEEEKTPTDNESR